jgi:8-oxo-dGTP diphosphatase
VSPQWTVHVFLSQDFEGTPADGREGITSWFDIDALPFKEMWEDDPYWYRLAIEGRRFEGWFYYSGDFEKLQDYRIVEENTVAARL